MTDSALRLFLDFDAISQRDKHQPPAFLHRRDRKFALLCEQRGEQPDTRRWLDHIAHLSGPGGTSPTPGEQTLRVWRRVNAGFGASGVVLGVLTMLGLLFYDGGQRINITVILAFVALQLLLAVFTTAQSLAGWQPWRWLLNRLQVHAESSPADKLHPLFMARAAQLGGLGFAASGLLTLLVMVVVQDLAFGWSTTLEAAATGYHQLLVMISAPWGWLWPGAVPDLALVEATRFYRSDTAANIINPQRWGQWWPFVAMLWTTWVLLPRLILSACAARLIQHKAHRLLAGHPAMHALQYRMETAILDTGSDHNDAADMPDTRTRSALQPLPESQILLCWAGAGSSELPDTLVSHKAQVFAAGGRATLAEDQHTQTLIADAIKAGTRPAVIVLTRCWEPPTGELQDFLEAAQAIWPDSTRIALVPLTPDMHQPPAAHQLQPWLRFAERMKRGFVGVSLLRPDWREPPTEQEFKP
jgi:hypothetical protein